MRDRDVEEDEHRLDDDGAGEAAGEGRGGFAEAGERVGQPREADVDPFRVEDAQGLQQAREALGLEEGRRGDERGPAEERIVVVGGIRKNGFEDARFGAGNLVGEG